MAGLNFQTQTIINAAVDKDSNNAALFELAKDINGNTYNALKIKRDFLFEKENVKVIRRALGYGPEMCKATIDFAEIASKMLTNAEGKKLYCRLDVYLGVEGAEPFIYSTPWVQKGMPFWVEFTVTDANKNNIAQHVADMISKNNLFQVDKDLLKVTVSGNALTLEGATEYQRFKKVEVRVFTDFDDDTEKIAELGDATIVLDKRGRNGFGTYSQIVKDLRLPTPENTGWTHVRQAETPEIGAVYDQYIIEYAAPASNEGLACVGQKLESHTTHVFWVKHDTALINAWETALGYIGFDADAEGAEQVTRDTDDVNDDITTNELAD